ncbi:MAG TPA: DUF3562 domain-containing protein [Steroidobacteraceae bacterium]|nr:DUF3562 domain-containing protein [Steroidobacteraceae bacterium]
MPRVLVPQRGNLKNLPLDSPDVAGVDISLPHPGTQNWRLWITWTSNCDSIDDLNRSLRTMSNQAIIPQELPSLESEIELLARETDTPVEIVYEIYTSERAKLDQAARIKTYVPVLIHRHVKELLQTRRGSIH